MPARGVAVRFTPAQCHNNPVISIAEPAGPVVCSEIGSNSSLVGKRARTWVPGAINVAPFSVVKSSSMIVDWQFMK